MPRRKQASTKKLRTRSLGRIALQAVKGMKDILPDDQPYWDLVRDVVQEMARAYGFYRIDTPILEKSNVFIRGVGAGTDIVDKEMFTFKDKGGGNVSLRPENTAGLVRAYIEHGLSRKPQPMKLYYLGPMFRYDQPQAGRQRQFYQFGFEVIGSASPTTDAQIILLTVGVFKEIGLPELSVQINSVGCPQCRPDYIQTLLNFYRGQAKRLCSDCKKRVRSNPLRLLDCKEEKCQRLANQAPVLIDSLCEECHDHFKVVLEHLDELEIAYNLNPKLVRGLDYYTKTVFEIWPANVKRGSASQVALGGGGRYDNLIEELGGRPTPGVGVSCGVERLISRLEELGINLPEGQKTQVFLAQLGELAKRKALVLFEQLRQQGINVAESFSRDSLKSQLKVAARLKTQLVLILGQKESLSGTILIRDMETGVQELVDIEKVASEIKKRLQKKK